MAAERDNPIRQSSDAYDLELATDSEIDNDEEYTSDKIRKILGLV